MEYERLTNKPNNTWNCPLWKDGACQKGDRVCFEIDECQNYHRLAELEDMIESGLLAERYFIKEELNPMAKYHWVVGEIIADHNTCIVKEQCKTKKAAEAKLKELMGRLYE